MDVAHDKRNIFLIKLRRINYLIFAVAKRIITKLRGERSKSQVRSILIYPAIRDKKNLAEILNKTLMGFPYKENLYIDFLVEGIDPQMKADELKTPAFQKRYLDSKKDHIKLIENESCKLSSYDRIFIWDNKYYIYPPIFFNMDKVEIIDKYFYAMKESSVWKDGYYNTFSENEIKIFQGISRRNYEALENKYENNEKSYCFLTGPTFNNYSNYNFEKNSLKIICNSIVINNEFLEYIEGPDIVTFSDPSFHFSSCIYASQFREHVKNVVEKYNSFVLVPESTVPLMLHHFPEFEKNIIGMGLTDTMNFPDKDNMNVHMSNRRGNSIITLFMIPVASSLSKKVFFVGADGREKKENYFWKHNKTVQLNDLMESVFQTHPSFFRDSNYGSYYERHCELIERLLRFGEGMKKEYYSLTASFIPALKNRFYNS